MYFLVDGFNIWLIICLGVIERSWFQVFDLKVNGVALRLLPEASQIKNALQVSLGRIVLYSSFFVSRIIYLFLFTTLYMLWLCKWTEWFEWNMIVLFCYSLGSSGWDPLYKLMFFACSLPYLRQLFLPYDLRLIHWWNLVIILAKILFAWAGDICKWNLRLAYLLNCDNCPGLNWFLCYL